MVTYFVLYDSFSRMFIRQGHSGGWTNSLNAAKHFTSKWSAVQYLSKMNADDVAAIIVKRIERF